MSEDVLNTGSTAPKAEGLTLEAAIGAEVRTLRRALDMTAADLAGAAGLSTGMLSKIENGAISPSLGTLQALARALNTPVNRFFARYEEPRDCSYVPAGQGVAIERRGTKAGHRYDLLGHALAGEVVTEPYLITLSPDAQPYPLFQHEGQEFIHMLSGEVVYRHADRTYHLRPGDSLLFDAAALHGPERIPVTPATYLSIIIHLRR